MSSWPGSLGSVGLCGSFRLPGGRSTATSVARLAGLLGTGQGVGRGGYPPSAPSSRVYAGACFLCGVSLGDPDPAGSSTVLSAARPLGAGLSRWPLLGGGRSRMERGAQAGRTDARPEVLGLACRPLSLVLAGDGHHHRLWGQGAPDVGREDHRLLLLRLRHLLLCASSGRCSVLRGPSTVPQPPPGSGAGRPVSRPRSGGAFRPQLACLRASGGRRLPAPGPPWVLCKCGRRRSPGLSWQIVGCGPAHSAAEASGEAATVAATEPQRGKP